MALQGPPIGMKVAPPPWRGHFSLQRLDSSGRFGWARLSSESRWHAVPPNAMKGTRRSAVLANRMALLRSLTVAARLAFTIQYFTRSEPRP